MTPIGAMCNWRCSLLVRVLVVFVTLWRQSGGSNWCPVTNGSMDFCDLGAK